MFCSHCLHEKPSWGLDSKNLLSIVHAEHNVRMCQINIDLSFVLFYITSIENKT